MLAFFTQNPLSATLLCLGTALMAVYVIICLRAEAPKSGTLEWISMYEKPKYHPYSNAYTLTGRDALGALAAFFLQAAFFLLFTLLQFSAGGGTSDWPSLLPAFFTAGFSAAVLWLLAKRLTASSAAAFLATALLVADLFHDSTPTLCLLTALLSLHIWFTRSGEKWGLDWLIVTAMALAVSVFFLPSFVVLCVPILVMIVFDGIWRVKHADIGGWLIPLGVLLFAVMLVFWMLAEFAVVVAAGFGFAALLDTLKSGSFFGAFLDCFAVWENLGFFPPMAAAHLWRHLPSVLLVAGSLVVLAVGAIRRKEPAALFLLVWCACLTALALCTETNLFSVTAALGCAYLSGRLIAREHSAAGVAGPAFTTAVTLLLSILIYV